MATFYDAINDKHRAFIAEQHMFFVATAAAEGRINTSPKGLDTFRVLSDSQVIYLDHVGSGNETAAHLLADGRITVMFISFSRNSNILRLYGRGRSVKPGEAEWGDLIAHFGEWPGVRQIFVIDVESVQDACGFGVPLIEDMADRETLSNWAGKKTPQEIMTFRDKHNIVSIDGLPTGLKAGE